MSSKRTRLFRHHKNLGAKFVDFAGWLMPIHYKGIIDEHKAFRERVGIFDVSHMGQIFVGGSQAVEFLSYITTWDMRRQNEGDCRYCHILNDDGMIIEGSGKIQGGEFNSFGDHRIAMTNGIAGLLASGVTTDGNSEDASVSYPSFWEVITELQV